MGSIITTKKGLLKLVKGQIEVEVNGSNQPAKDGEQLPKGAVLHIGENATYEITFDDGTKLSNEINEIEVNPASAAVVAPVTGEATPDEIQALQDLIASGEDPTKNLPETAAGNAPASDGNSGYVSLARDGSEALATSGYSTSGQTLAAFAPDTPEQSIATDSPSLLANDSITVDEDSAATGNVLSNDSDIDSTLSVVSFTVNGNTVTAGTTVALEGGSLIINADGSYTFTPNANWNGQVPVITYTTNTGATATLTINVTPVDDPSVLVNDTNTVAEDSVATGNVLSNDSDIDNTLSVVSFTVNGNTVTAGTTALEGGSLIINADGSYTFTPNANWNGTVPVITYTTNTGATATLTINVTPVDDPSILVNDTNTVAEDSVATGNVLSNDSDIDSTLSVVSFTVNGNTVTAGTSVALEGGSLIINADGSYTFTPNANWNGQVPVITYTTNTGSTATLTINVTPEGDPANISVNDTDNGTVTEDGDSDTDVATVQTVGGKLDVTDVDNGEAVFQVQTNVADGNYGTFSIDADGNWTYVLNNSHIDVQSLAAGETLTRNITVTSADGTATHTVTITIVGANDPADITVGEGQGDTDNGTVTEDGDSDTDVATVQTVGGKLDVTDVDNGEAVFQVQTNVADGNYGTFSIDADGNWTYVLNNSHIDVQSLAAGETLTRNITVTSADGTATHTVTITIVGANDPADITVGEGQGDTDNGTVTEDGDSDTDVATVQTVGGKLDVTDVDNGEAVFQVQTNVADGNYGTFSIDADGNWTYVLNNSHIDVQSLAAGETLTRNITVTSADGTATHTVTITIVGANDPADITVGEGQGDTDNGTVTEDGDSDTDVATVQTVGGKLDVTDVDNGEAVFQVQTNVADGNYGTFSIDADGNWTYVLNNSHIDVQSLAAGETLTRNITVTSADGTATHTVTITIVGANDPADITVGEGQGDTDNGTVTEDGDSDTDVATVQTVGGKLDVTDVDNGEAVFQVQTNVADGNYGTFSIDADGNWTYVLNNSHIDVQSLAAGETLTRNITVTSADGTATHTVTITIVGANDPADITVGEGQGDTDNGTVTEDGDSDTDVATVQTVGGKLDVTDVDNGEAVFQVQTNVADGNYGTFSIDADGNWTYVLNNSHIDVQSLAAGETLTRNITVTSADGTATHTVTITIVGANDPADITVGEGQGDTDNGTVTEDGDSDTDVATVQTVGGKLDVTDVDNGEAVFQVQTNVADGNYGTFSIDADGNWTYVLNNSHIDVQSLAAGETLTRNITVTSADGTATHTVTITIVGANDPADITVGEGQGDTDNGTVTEDGDSDTDVATVQTVGGKLDVTDVDNGEAVFQVQTNVADGNYGTFSIDADGNWTYVLNNSHIDVQSLAAGETLTRNITVTSADGTATHTVTITIVGANDPADITVGEGQGDTDNGTVTEDGDSDTDVATVQTVGGKLDVTDVDNGEAVFQVQTNVADGNYGTFSIDADGNWTYVLNNSHIDVQSLAAGETLTRNITVTSADGTATHTVTITIVGANDPADITVGEGQGDTDNGTVTEDGDSDTDVATVQTVGGKLDVTDVDNGEAVFQVQTNVADGNYGTFSIDADGNWTYVLNNSHIDVQSLAAGETLTRNITVTSADGTATHTVTITIVGANDPADITVGEGQGDTDNGTVTEDGDSDTDVATVQTVGGKLDVTDVDNGEAVFQVQTNVADGNYGTFSIDADGNWTYVLNNSHIDVQSLAAGETLTRNITVTSADGTATHTVTITIVGANDPADITVGEGQGDTDNGTVTEDGDSDTDVATVQTVGGKLDVTDVDNGEAVFQVQTNVADGNYGTFSIDADGNWTYVLNNSHIDVQSLAAGETLTRNITVTSADGTATHTVTITIVGTNDSPVITNNATQLVGSVVEAGDLDDGTDVAGTPTATGQLSATDVDNGATQTWSVQGTPDTTYGSFSVDATGKWTYTLDNTKAATQALAEGQSQQLTFTVRVTDDKGAWVDQLVTITIVGTNDSPVITNNATQLVGSVVEAGDLDDGTDVAGTPTATGQLSATDVDNGATQTWSVQGTPDTTYGSFSVDATGKWTYTLDNTKAATQALAEGQSQQLTFTVRVTDDKGAWVDQLVTITIVGTNDSPVITNNATQLVGSVVEAGDLDDGTDVAGTPTATGQLSATDVDNGATQTWSVQGTPDTTYGSFSVDATGKWTYTLDNTKAATQALAEGQSQQLTFTVRVTDDKGAWVDQLVTITIVGTNDSPVITNNATQLVGSVVEAGDLDDGTDVAGTPTATGQLSATDVDNGATQTWSVQGTPDTTYGSFSVDATGKWTYTLDNTKAATQALAEGQSQQLTFTVRVTDDKGAWVDQLVTITIVGTNDSPVITNNATQLVGSVVEAGDLDDGTDVAGTPTATGQLSATDVDNGATQTWSVQGTPDTTYGSFSVDATGKWTYTLDNTKAATQALAEGQSQQLTFTVRVTDDKGAWVDQLVTITIVGTNDSPVITNNATQLVGSVVEAGDLDDGTDVAGTPTATGQLSATDVDNGATQTWSVQGTPDTTYGSFSVDATGKWTYTLDNTKAATQALAEGQSQQLTFTVRVTDDKGAWVDQLVTITIVGTNDSPVITNNATQLVGSVVEAGDLDDGTDVAGTPTATGQLSATDVDNGATQTWSVQGTPDTTYGSFSVDATGKWTYTLDNTKAATQALAEGQSQQLTFTVRVTDDKGAWVDQLVTITIVGTNDSPVITNNATQLVGSVVEAGDLDDGTDVAGTPTATGQLSATDVDNGATQTWSVQGTPDTTYGSFSVDATGKWTYTLDNTKAATQALAEGQSQQLTFTVRVTDDKGAWVDQLVTITIVGTNDSPVITNNATQLVGSVVEAGDLDDGTDVAGTPTATGQLSATDVDNGATQTWSVQGTPDTTYGSFSVDATGKWTYTLDNTKAATQALAEGQSQQLTFTVRVTDDKGAWVDQLVTITIVGTNDSPVITNNATQLVGSVVEAGDLDDGTDVAGTPTATGQLSATDVDNGATQTWSVQGTPDTTYGSFSVDATGKWTYTLDNTKAATQALAEGQSQQLTFTVRVTDDKGAWVDQLVTITIVGTNDSPVITNNATQLVGSVVEAGDLDDGTDVAGTPTATGQLSATDVDNGATQTWSVQGTPDTTYGSFSVDATGKWTYTLDNTKAATQALAEGQSQQLTFTVRVTDDKGAWVDQLVTITIVGTNDSPVITNNATQLVGSVVEAGDLDDGTDVAGTPTATGQLSATDVDNGATQTWSVQGTPDTTYGSFSVDATGKWTYTLDNTKAATQALAEGQSQQLTFTVRVTDDKGAWVDQLVTITIVGTNDSPVITNNATQLVGSVVEAGDLDDGTDVAGTPTATGQLSATDVDNGATQTWSVQGTPDTTYGSFSVDATGKWTYTLDNTKAATQALAEGQSQQLTFTVRVTDDKGAWVDQLVTITIVGTNDSPVITNNATQLVGSVVEAGDLDDGTDVAGTPTATGQLSATDVDNGATQTWSVQGTPDTTYGSFSVDATGKWTYTLDNTKAATQALAEGQSQQLTFTVRVTDDKGAWVDQLVTITIVGTNDSPVITNNATQLVGSVVEAGDLDDGTDVAGTPTATGQLSATDVDNGATQTWSVQGTPDTTYGSFSVDATGKWTYTLDNTKAATQALAEGQSQQLTFTVRVTDDKGAWVDQLVTITIVGTNDAPIISNQEFGYFENQIAGAVVANVVASDIDGTVTGFSFKWTDGSYHAVSEDGYFSIDNTGKVTMTASGAAAAVNDFEQAPNSGVYVVTATDNNGANSDANITLFEKDLDDTPPASPTVWIVDDGMPGDGLLTSSEIASGGADVQISVSIDGAEFVAGGYVTLTINGGAAIELSFTDFTDNGSGTLTFGNFTYANGVISWSEAAPTAGQSITVTATQTDTVGNTSAQDSDTATVYQPNSCNVTVNESSLRDNIPDTFSNTISFTAGNQNITQFRFNASSISAATNLAAGVNIVWALAANGALVGTIDGIEVIKVTLSGTSVTSGLAAGTTDAVTVNVELLDNIKQVNGLSGENLSSLINGIVIEAVGADNSVLTGNVSITINDDVINIAPSAGSGVNSATAVDIVGTLNILGADGNDHTATDNYSVSLSANVTGWNGTSTTFADSGITAGGLTVYYYVDPAHPNVLIAYTDTSGTTSAYTHGANQTLIFTLTTNATTGQYIFDMNQGIDKLATIQIAGLVGGKGGIGEAVYVTYDPVTHGYGVYNDITKIPADADIAFTLTARDGNNNVAQVNGTNNGFGVANPFVNGDEVLIVDYSENAATASFSFTGATQIHYKAYDDQGNLLHEGNITNGQLIQNVGSIAYIELSALSGTSFQFTGTTAQTIVSSSQSLDLSFVVTATDSDGDKSSGNLNVHLDPPSTTPLVPVALTPNTFATLNEADLQAGAPDSSVQTLSFKSGSNSIGSFQFGDISNISVVGINAQIHWAVNDQGQLIGTVYGREAIRLTLDWDRINAGEQGDVTVTAQLLTNLPHSVNTNSLTVNGIQVIAVDGVGNTAHSNVTVTVADDVNLAQNDTAQLDVVVDSFNFSGIVANWTGVAGGTYVNTYDGPDNDNGNDQLRWGSTNGSQSGYGFADNDAALNGSLSLNQDIVLGKFTHYNYSIDSGTSITAATMKVTFNVTDAYGVVTPVTLTLNFSHNETPNSNDPVSSRDIVTVGQTSVTFNYEGQMYTMQVVGFKDTNGNIVTSIYTNEGAATSYELVVRMVAGNGYTLPHTDGNVLTNDVAGADGVLTVIGVATGDHTNTGVSGQVGTTIIGTYGNLVLNADGTYQYQLTASANTIPATGAIETFTYTTQDGDGDKASATLKIDVNPVNANGINIADANLISTQGSNLNDTIIVEHGERANSAGQKVLNVSFGGGQSGIITNSSSKEVVASGANNKSYTTSSAQVVSGGDGNDHIETGKGDDVIYAGKTGAIGYGTDDQLELSVNALSTHHIMTGTLSGTNSIVDSDGLLLANDVASQRADVVNGGSGNDRIYGQSGSDILYGHTGNDYIDGGSHNDALRGGEGNDTLIGGLGDDVLRGDSGADTFVWRYADADKGTDHIMDFKVGEDKLDLSDLLQGETANTLESYLNFSLNNGSTVIDIDANKDGTFDQHIVLDGVNLYSQFGATDNAGIINGLLGSNGNGPLIIDTAPPVTPDAPQGVTPLTDPHNNIIP
ncbi:VCBS domain-containing protein [Shewanella xiamenensis]|uniref:VCBS domain-containing protein n=3 Tax=Shewanella xiamenensis TaxID=332186 RepID=UPI001CC3D42D|nr:VCBS domain-containing protein [Shewanella xiamenensis]BDA58947.1 type I secretion C-terminal target domain-containing protein [Shewanella xiamenensis]